jgi:hypothetical protein
MEMLVLQETQAGPEIRVPLETLVLLEIQGLMEQAAEPEIQETPVEVAALVPLVQQELVVIQDQVLELEIQAEPLQPIGRIELDLRGQQEILVYLDHLVLEQPQEILEVLLQLTGPEDLVLKAMQDLQVHLEILEPGPHQVE